MTRPFLDALRRYFSSRGYVEVSMPLQGGLGLAFEKGDERVAVFIIDEEAVKLRGELIKRLMKASKGENFDLVYVAAPKLIATVLDASVFVELGVGLLVVGENVVEAAPAKKRSQPIIGEDLRRRLMRLEERIDALEAEEARSEGVESLTERITRLELEVEALKDNISKSLRRLDATLSGILAKVNALEEVLVSLKRVKMPAVSVKEPGLEPGVTVADEGLPSFFKDNPWLKILSSKGRES